MRSALTSFKPTEPLIAATEHHLSRVSGRIKKGGFYHDGRFATLGDVAQHYNQFFGLGLGTPEINDLVEYLKSLSD
jgi:hypothetical protein